ncbi:RNA polymerase sigma factor FliA [Paenibacillus sp. CECT 9249]|nr:RNA polymerase sigma factor FliA [Paenibacillus sp. CECT 9249]
MIFIFYWITGFIWRIIMEGIFDNRKSSYCRTIGKCGEMMVETLETRLALLARKGDQRAFAEIVDLFKDKIFHLAYRMLNNRHEAEDVVQDTFLRVFKNLDRYDEHQKFSTWIYRIGTNLCIDRLRKRKPTYSLDAEMNDQEGIDGYSMIPSDDVTPESELIVSETQQLIRDAIDTLPAKYKSVMILRYLQDLSLQEISDVLDMPVTTIKTRVHRGREFLRKRLERKL